MSGTQGNPAFLNLVPPITYDVSIDLDYQSGTYSGSIYHSNFPSFQVYINGLSVYNYMENSQPGFLGGYNTDYFMGTIPGY